MNIYVQNLEWMENYNAPPAVVPKPSVLITKKFLPEAVAFLKQHADVDYEATDDGLTREALIQRLRNTGG